MSTLPGKSEDVGTDLDGELLAGEILQRIKLQMILRDIEKDILDRELNALPSSSTTR